MERQLATIRQIDAINPIPDADAIEVATVGGWMVVIKKGEFRPGDHGLYLEIDTWVPEALAPFLFKGRTFNDVPGERLRTIKLRGQISQGLLLPLASLPHGFSSDDGDDLSALLGLQKYERPLHGSLGGTARGNFPSFIRKTDQERAQNLSRDIARWAEDGGLWEVTEKLDGSSATFYLNGGSFGVCSRNLDLLETEGNAFWQVARKHNIEDRLRAIGRNIAIQGELIGGKIQGNIYKLSEQSLYVFDIWDIDAQAYLSPAERLALTLGLDHAPVVADADHLVPMADLLLLADGQSMIGAQPAREGLVFKSLDGANSFKAISNKWLLKNDG